jgi:hypothetical protein
LIKCLKCSKLVKGRSKGLCRNCDRLYKQSLLPKIYCFCGCGELIPSLTLDNKPSKYKKGHHIKGKNNPYFNNGRSIDKEYIIISKSDHPYTRINKFVPEHRLIYEHYLYILFDEPIYIPKEIDIDHINKNKKDNSLINLRPLYKSQHIKRHAKERRELIDNNRFCFWCSKQGKKIRWFRYGYNWICRHCNNKYLSIQQRYYNEILNIKISFRNIR